MPWVLIKSLVRQGTVNLIKNTGPLCGTQVAYALVQEYFLRNVQKKPAIF